MKYRRRIERILSEGQGKQLLLVLLIVLAVLAILLFIGRLLFGDLDWQKIVAIFLDPGVFDGHHEHDWFRLIVALLGIFLFSALFVSVFINVIDNIVNAYKNGENRYRFSGHILIIGAPHSLMDMLSAIQRDDKLSRKDVLVMTACDVPTIREQIQDRFANDTFSRNVTLYRSDRESIEDLREACADKAEIIYLLGEEQETHHDALNLQCLDYLRELCSQPGPVIHCYVTMEMHSTLDVIKYMKGVEESRLCVDFINESDYLVERMLVYSDFLPALTPQDEDIRTRIVIIGESRIGRAIAGVAAQLCHYPNFKKYGPRTQITLIDTGMRKGMSNFIANHAGMFELCHYHYISPDNCESFAPKPEYGDFMDLEWSFIDADPASPFVRSLLEKWVTDPKERMVMSICYFDYAKSLSTALHLPRILYDRKCPIRVFQQNYSVLVDDAGKTGMYGDLAAFGNNTEPVDSLFLRRTLLGKRLNRLYDLEYGNPPASDADAAWKSLLQAHKFSSIASANFMPMLLRCYALEPTKAVFSSISDELLEQISEVEHRRWMSSVLMLGYYPAPRELRSRRDLFKYLKNERFIHLDLAPYDELLHDQEKDRLIVSNIPYILNGEE